MKEKAKIWILLTLFSATIALFYGVPRPDDFPTFFWLFTLQFIIYSCLLYYTRKAYITVPLLIFVAIFNRLLLLWSVPVLENDYFRYLWDGRVIANGINPYLHAPSSAALDSISVWYRDRIGWPDIRTIYPPIAQFFFGGLHLVGPDSLIALKVGLIVAEVLTGLLLISLVNDKRQRQLVTILYFFNPLLLKEISNSAHLDALPMLLSFAAVVCFIRYRNQRWVAWGLLALSVGAKSYPVLLVPLFLRLDSKRVINASLFIVILVTLYLPFIGAGANLFSGAGAFGTYWIFNAGAFKLIASLSNALLTLLFSAWVETDYGKFILTNDYPAKVIVGLILIGYLAITTKQLKSAEQLPRATLAVLGMLLLISPVVNAWYVLWLLPFACLEGRISWISFTYLVVAAYSWFWSESAAPAIRAIEYLCLYSIFIWEWVRRSRFTNLTNSPLGAGNG